MQSIKWLWSLFFGKPCHKTDLGYTCRHRVNANGTKECD